MPDRSRSKRESPFVATARIRHGAGQQVGPGDVGEVERVVPRVVPAVAQHREVRVTESDRSGREARRGCRRRSGRHHRDRDQQGDGESRGAAGSGGHALSSRPASTPSLQLRRVAGPTQDRGPPLIQPGPGPHPAGGRLTGAPLSRHAPGPACLLECGLTDLAALTHATARLDPPLAALDVTRRAGQPRRSRAPGRRARPCASRQIRPLPPRARPRARDTRGAPG